ncbi:hypothetical protein O998_03480 [Anaplasma phagocytophilum str. Norway variant1]|uniref:Uncharacterized protein n=1 Tax=Anaplasma phagocytophilum str. Norway variant1 TaxID=1392506 RepID=A0A7H9E085_ANAPH|nr:hypothetical protein [Anaplasma phagocytophilum]QLL66839.1 hypothetical protein O998_03480 [Anaplasma phagocytophilum str. Norway variant1]
MPTAEKNEFSEDIIEVSLEFDSLISTAASFSDVRLSDMSPEEIFAHMLTTLRLAKSCVTDIKGAIVPSEQSIELKQGQELSPLLLLQSVLNFLDDTQGVIEQSIRSTDYSVPRNTIDILIGCYEALKTLQSVTNAQSIIQNSGAKEAPDLLADHAVIAIAAFIQALQGYAFHSTTEQEDITHVRLLTRASLLVQQAMSILASTANPVARELLLRHVLILSLTTQIPSLNTPSVLKEHMVSAMSLMIISISAELDKFISSQHITETEESISISVSMQQVAHYFLTAYREELQRYLGNEVDLGSVDHEATEEAGNFENNMLWIRAYLLECVVYVSSIQLTYEKALEKNLQDTEVYTATPLFLPETPLTEGMEAEEDKATAIIRDLHEHVLETLKQVCLRCVVNSSPVFDSHNNSRELQLKILSHTAAMQEKLGNLIEELQRNPNVKDCQSLHFSIERVAILTTRIMDRLDDRRELYDHTWKQDYSFLPLFNGEELRNRKICKSDYPTAFRDIVAKQKQSSICSAFKHAFNCVIEACACCYSGLKQFFARVIACIGNAFCCRSPTISEEDMVIEGDPDAGLTEEEELLELLMAAGSSSRRSHSRNSDCPPSSSRTPRAIATTVEVHSQLSDVTAERCTSKDHSEERRH